MVVWRPLGFLYGELDDGEPFVGIILVPYAVDIDSTGRFEHFIAGLLHVFEELAIRLVEFLIRAIMLEANGCLYRGEIIERDELRIRFGAPHCFAILDRDIRRRIFGVEFAGETQPRFGTFAAQSLHFRPNNLTAELA